MHRRGFTIVELLIVIVVIAILAAITVVAYNGIQSRAQDSAAQSALASAAKKIALYRVDNSDTYPSSLAAAGVTNTGSAVLAYNYDATNDSYCLSSTVSTRVYAVTQASQIPVSGGCAGTTSGATAWWPLNGNGDDLSGNGRTVPVVSGMTSAVGQSGAASTAYTFNGSAQPNFSPITLTSSSFSISAWVYLDAYNVSGYNQAPVIGQSSSAGGPLTAMHFGFRSVDTATAPRIYMDYYASGQAATTLVGLSNWYHITYTYNQPNNTRTFYLNGAQDAVAGSGGIYTGTINTLGGSCCMNGGLRGRLDDVRVYNRALSAPEVTALYTKGAL